MKERIMCKTHCFMWNDIDKDCEIYGENHPCPRGCPYYQTHTAFEHTKEIDRLRDTLTEKEKQIERLQAQLESAQDVIYEYIKIYGVERECSKYLEKYAKSTK